MVLSFILFTFVMNNLNNNIMKTQYSKDFNFFLKEQIFLSTTNNGLYSKFISRLDGKVFKPIDGCTALSDDDVKSHCKTIHKDLKYYD